MLCEKKRQPINRFLIGFSKITGLLFFVCGTPVVIVCLALLVRDDFFEFGVAQKASILFWINRTCGVIQFLVDLFASVGNEFVDAHTPRNIVCQHAVELLL